MHRLLNALFAMLVCVAVACGQETQHRLGFRSLDGEVVVTVNEESIASYIYNDPEIPRPFFAHVKAPSGVQVTRNHPPKPGADRLDHDTMHPGIWMAFGDLDGSDFWRNRAAVRHVRFLQEPSAERNVGSFIEEKCYVRPDGTQICTEEFRFAARADEDGYLFVWYCLFRSDHEFYFGDQEEMGLGLRVATPLSEVNGGRLSDSDGRTGAKTIWSNAAGWCDYSGTVDARPVGMTLMCHPSNFRHSWMHARDYGLVVANPFGRNAMKKGQPSRVTVKPGEPLKLQYAVWVHSGDGGRPNRIERLYAEYSGLGKRQ